MDTFSREVTAIFSFTFLPIWNKLFPLRVDPFGKGFVAQGSKWRSKKLSSLDKMVGKHIGVPIT